MLLQTWTRGLLDALLLSIVLCGVLFALLFFVFGTLTPVWAYALPVLLSLVLVFVKRWHVWSHALFRVTTERILLQSPGTLFHPPLRTIKWPQYQESEAGHRHFFDYLFLSRSIHIRFGTADAQHEAEYPSLRYAHDLKHYLDKVDSAVRKNGVASIQPFVAKPRGKRDLPDAAPPPAATAH